MTYFKIECDTCYAGESCECIRKITSNKEEDYDIEGYVQDCCRDNAEMYGTIEQARQEAEDSDIEFEESDCCSYNINQISEKEALESGIEIEDLR